MFQEVPIPSSHPGQFVLLLPFTLHLSPSEHLPAVTFLGGVPLPLPAPTSTSANLPLEFESTCERVAATAALKFGHSSSGHAFWVRGPCRTKEPAERHDPLVVQRTEGQERPWSSRAPFPPPSAGHQHRAMVGDTQAEGEVRLTRYLTGRLPPTPHSVMENKGRGSPNKE